MAALSCLKNAHNQSLDFLIMAAPGFKCITVDEKEEEQIKALAKETPSEFYVFQNQRSFNEDVSYLS